MTNDPLPKDAQSLARGTLQPNPLRSLSVFSHEARSTLHNMLGYIRLLQMNAPGDMIEHLNIVENCSTHLLTLIEGLSSSNTRSSEMPPKTETAVDAQVGHAGALAPLASLELLALEKMMLTGRLPRISEWAITLAESYPEQAHAARRVVQLSKSANLPELEKMLAHWRALA